MNIVVISPHPDDETLGAGGTILRYKAEGHKVYWINITDASVEYGWDKQFIDRRKEQIKEVKDFYEFDGFYNLALPPAKLESIDKDKIILKINEYFKKIKPNWIIMPDYNDAHSDHKVTFDCCFSCTKVFRHPYIKKISTMEILSETDFGRPNSPFIPNLFVDISDYMKKKLEAIQIYETELGMAPFPRNIESIRSQANLRGVAAGTIYAEAFRLIKLIE